MLIEFAATEDEMDTCELAWLDERSDRVTDVDIFRLEAGLDDGEAEAEIDPVTLKVLTAFELVSETIDFEVEVADDIVTRDPGVLVTLGVKVWSRWAEEEVEIFAVSPLLLTASITGLEVAILGLDVVVGIFVVRSEATGRVFTLINIEFCDFELGVFESILATVLESMIGCALVELAS